MPIPTHGPDCVTRCWWTNCWSCHQRIYVVTCNHGSGVPLDQQGWPWPIHECGSSSGHGMSPDVPAVKRGTNSDGNKTFEIKEWGITVIQPEGAGAGNLIPSTKQWSSELKTQIDPIISMPPDEHGACQVTGVLREVGRSVNHMKAFGYDDDGPMAVAMAQAILGNRWANEFGRITLHAPRLDSSQLESYTAWVPASVIRNRRIKQGITVSVKLVSIDVSDRYRDWYCDDFQVDR